MRKKAQKKKKGLYEKKYKKMQKGVEKKEIIGYTEKAVT